MTEVMKGELLLLMYICSNTVLASEKERQRAETMWRVPFPPCDTCVLFMGGCATDYQNVICVNTYIIYNLSCCKKMPEWLV